MNDKTEQNLEGNLERYTTADEILNTFNEAGISCVFANLGSDHPAIIESLAKANSKEEMMPRMIICPHEQVALSAAHGYFLLSGKAQAVLLHVDVGTQNLGGSLHNAKRGRIPALIFAGASPYTMEGEMAGSRNEYIHFYQDSFDQIGFVRENTKWNYEIRTGKNVRQVIYRALQIAESDPKGPVYMVGAREVLEENIKQQSTIKKGNGWGTIYPSAIPLEGIQKLSESLMKAKKPLIITTYLGREPKAVTELMKLSERLAIPVLEAGPYYMNFPSDHSMHVGYTRNEFVSDSDLILVIDSDVPWIPSKVEVNENCEVYYIDIDPLKEEMPLWYIPSINFFKADAATALKQLNDYLNECTTFDEEMIKQRFLRISEKHTERFHQLAQKEIPHQDIITPEWLTTCLREELDENTIVFNETVSNVGTVWSHLRRNVPGTLFGSGGSSLGWGGAAALGAKLARPDKTIVCLQGDGSFIFGSPTAVYWASRKYHAPFLTIIYNNRGWKSPKLSTLGVHPEGYAKNNDLFWVNFDPHSDLAKVAEAAGGAFAKTISHPSEVKESIQEALGEVRGGRSAVLNVLLEHISTQQF